jgi:predicted nucleic acid-binding protein
LEERLRWTLEVLQGRILPFDAAAAEAGALLRARRHRRGQVIEMRDTQIAGIALSRRASIATRNTRHFADLDVPVLDPWAG